MLYDIVMLYVTLYMLYVYVRPHVADGQLRLRLCFASPHPILWDGEEAGAALGHSCFIVVMIIRIMIMIMMMMMIMIIIIIIIITITILSIIIISDTRPADTSWASCRRVTLMLIIVRSLHVDSLNPSSDLM